MHVYLFKKMIQNTCNLKLHEILQSYFEELYSMVDAEMKQSMFGKLNEIYGELYYYSVVKLLRYLQVTRKDVLLDIGSGLGRFVFQIFLLTDATSVIGVEINKQRYDISCKIKEKIQEQLPDMYGENRSLAFLWEDFLNCYFQDVTIVYVCSTVFSFEFLTAIGKKINQMQSVQKVVSLRKIPNLYSFEMSKKIFLQGTWDNSPCYLYTKKV